MPKKIFLIACENSGDLHGAELITALKKIDPAIEFRGLGGPQMARAGLAVVHDMTTISALGFSDVLRQYFTYRRIFYQALHDAAAWKPDALILIDSPAFNLRFAKKARKLWRKLPILYYICPQIWAWGGLRIRTVKKTISKMFSILPFEVDFYSKAGVACDFVGHPLLDHVKTSAGREDLRKRRGIQPEEKAIGLLPGSRKSEVSRILPVMLQSSQMLQTSFPEARFFLSRSPNVPAQVYQDILDKFNLYIRDFDEHFYDNIAAMDFALVTSGTATLQTALVQTPFFLLYKAGWTTYFLGRHLIRVPYLGIVNLLANKPIVPEFIQEDAHPESIAHEARIMFTNKELMQTMREELAKIPEILGQHGASQKAATSILEFLTQQEEAARQTRA